MKRHITSPHIARSILLVLAALNLTATVAQAHFLFVRILPAAEAGRAAEVYFSEKADAGDPRYIDKVASTKLWLQSATGDPQELAVSKATDRLRAHLPLSGSVEVFGLLNYGVLARPQQTPFLLRHYPKAVSGKPDELNHITMQGQSRFEFVPHFDGDQVLLTVLHDGKPQPRVTVNTIDVNLVGDELTTDDQGHVAFKPPAPGVYSVYTQHVDKIPGDHNGKQYDEVREFATLTFAWPLSRTDADPEAVKLFEEAVAARAQWKDFPGFTATVDGNIDGRPVAGDVTVTADGSVTIEAADEPTAAWVREQLESIIRHRVASEASPDASRPVLRFADENVDHPLGRLLEFDGGQFASSYRVRDRQIMVVNRHFGEQDMTITVLDNERTADDHFLPRSYTVQYWDAKDGHLDRTESVQDRWRRVGEFDLPQSHAVTTATSHGLTVRTFSLSAHKLLPPKKDS
ncbi:MAG TPA: DUF3386 family protein [Pirellulales bacterium]